MHRYGSLDEIMRMDAGIFLTLVDKAHEEAVADRAHRQWSSMLPLMCMKYIEYESFQNYLDRLTGKGIDQRPASDIMAEIMEIRKEMEG